MTGRAEDGAPREVCPTCGGLDPAEYVNDPPHTVCPMCHGETTVGTPAITLGFTREELEAMEVAAFPDAIETWLHGLVTAALSGEVVYKHQWPTEPEGDASRG